MSGNLMMDEFTWQPPSEAEMKILEAQRERSDKISKRMGDYLLKGYKMLGTVCDTCDTILLEDKSGVKYCVACKELDTDTEKDDPVVSSTAARSLTEERLNTCQPASLSSAVVVQQNPYQANSQRTTSDARLKLYETDTRMPVPEASSGGSERGVHLQSSVCDSVVNSLCDKIQWAGEELKQSRSVEHSIQLCQLIKASADALQSLKHVQQ